MLEKTELEVQVEQRKKTIHADSYPMSIGEVLNMYNDGELDIRPEFQRFYRWTKEQKTKLIESIFLGIPIPSFFVSQRDDGIWEVVDGLQRLSTIFEFIGVLQNEKNERVDELELTTAKYLPALEHIKWSTLGNSLKLQFKREKIDFKIIKKESTRDTKYEIFQRLNTGGNTLSDQEVRNCTLLMINPEFYYWLDSLGKFQNFKTSIVLSETQLAARYDLELLTRFLVISNTLAEYRGSDLKTFLDEQIISFAQDVNFNYSEQKSKFIKVFELIEKSMGENAFRKYYKSENRHKGAFSLSLFEAITYGIAQNLENYDSSSTSIERISAKIQDVSESTEFTRYSGSGTNASSRFRYLLPKAKEIFKHD